MDIADTAIQSGIMVATATAGWFVKTAHSKLDKQDDRIKEAHDELDALKEEHSDFREKVAEEYVRNDVLQPIINRIDSNVTEIRSLLMKAAK